MRNPRCSISAFASEHWLEVGETGVDGHLGDTGDLGLGKALGKPRGTQGGGRSTTSYWGDSGVLGPDKQAQTACNNTI